MNAREELEILAKDDGPIGCAELFLRMEYRNDPDQSVADDLENARKRIRAIAATLPDRPASAPEGCTPVDAMVLRTANHCLQAEIDRLTAENESLLNLSAGLDEHPENYDGPCMCKLCMSYASNDEAAPKDTP